MTNALNTGAWAGIYAAGLIGTGKVFNAGYSAVKATATWVYNSVAAREVQSLPREEYKANVKELCNGSKWIAAAFVVRQLVVQFWSPVPAAGVVKALSVFGWKPVRSPLVDSVAAQFNALTGLKLTLS